jgi:hypothetical protein
MNVLFQDVAVTTVALGAAFVLCRRVVGVLGPMKADPGCPSCPSAKVCPKGVPASDDTPVPLLLHKKGVHGTR